MAEPVVRFTLNIPADLYKRIEQASYGQTLTAWVLQAIRNEVGRFELTDEEERLLIDSTPRMEK